MEYNVTYQGYDFLKTCTPALIIRGKDRRHLEANIEPVQDIYILYIYICIYRQS